MFPPGHVPTNQDQEVEMEKSQQPKDANPQVIMVSALVPPSSNAPSDVNGYLDNNRQNMHESEESNGFRINSDYHSDSMNHDIQDSSRENRVITFADEHGQPICEIYYYALGENKEEFHNGPHRRDAQTNCCGCTIL